MNDVMEAMEESFHEPDDSSTRETKKKHECTICGFATDRLYNFRRHLKVHSDGYRYQSREGCLYTLQTVPNIKRIDKAREKRSHQAH